MHEHAVSNISFIGRRCKICGDWLKFIDEELSRSLSYPFEIAGSVVGLDHNVLKARIGNVRTQSKRFLKCLSKRPRISKSSDRSHVQLRNHFWELRCQSSELTIKVVEPNLGDTMPSACETKCHRDDVSQVPSFSDVPSPISQLWIVKHRNPSQLTWKVKELTVHRPYSICAKEPQFPRVSGPEGPRAASGI